jgi:hypothetical protein
MIFLKFLAEGFGKNEDLILNHEINLRVFLNCKFSLFFIQGTFMFLEIIGVKTFIGLR